MKKALVLFAAALFVAACNPTPKTAGKTMAKNGKTLVAYFSATGAKAARADIHEIKPAVAYTSDDLNWRNKNSRSAVEMHDKTSRPDLAADRFSVKEYDTIFLGFPIWWGTAPHIVETFLEGQDFSNKKIIIFATSGSSDLGHTDEDLKPSVAPSAVIVKGKILNGNPSVEELKAWVETL